LWQLAKFVLKDDDLINKKDKSFLHYVNRETKDIISLYWKNVNRPLNSSGEEQSKQTDFGRQMAKISQRQINLSIL
jgi:hypothetical protein